MDSIVQDDGSPATPSSKTSSRTSTSGHHHKKSTSVNHLISRLPFFRTPETSPKSPTVDDTVPFPDVQDVEGDFALPPRNNALATALMEDKTRRRKGSLRKAALLGTGKLLIDHRRHGSADITKPPRSPTKVVPVSPTGKSPRKTSVSKGARLDGADATSPTSPISPIALTFGGGSTLDSADDSSPSMNPVLLSPLTTPTYASTTSDDEPFAASSPLTSPIGHKPSPSPSPPSSESSMATTASSLLSRRTTPAKQLKPPTSPLSLSSTDPPLLLLGGTSDQGEWDYSATEWWGWTILIVTWAVFVVGMGSCFEVWSWAWDVGHTPYAPPELEDDPTLPIVGYYPALIILTAVMSWVWVVVAWMGMKYFRHARTHDQG